jgi:peroxiredoxin
MVRVGDTAPDFTLPAVLAPGDVSLSDELRRGAVLLGLFRGLHCPFCRRQISHLSALSERLESLGVRIVAVVNTPRDRAAVYFRQRPPRVTVLADAHASTHRLFGIPSVVLDHAFAAVRVNPTGELAMPLHPMEANVVLNVKDGFVPTAVDEEVFATHGKQLAGHFLIDRDGIVRWASLEAERGIHTIVTFPTPEEIVTAVRMLHREAGRAAS